MLVASGKAEKLRFEFYGKKSWLITIGDKRKYYATVMQPSGNYDKARPKSA